MVDKTTFKIRLDEIVDVSKLDPSKKDRLKNEIGEFVVDNILRDTSNQRSAVTGRGWKGLSKDYKKIKSKIAPGIANLELHGDMLDALKAVNYRDGVEIGIFDYDQAQKSDNHNKFSGKSMRTALPQRQFLPREGEKLRPGIMKEVTKLAKDILNESENND